MASREKFYLVKQTIVPENYDMFAISESWLDPSTTNNYIWIPGYVIFYNNNYNNWSYDDKTLYHIIIGHKMTAA